MTGDVNDIMPGSDGLGFLVILNKSSELRFGLEQSELIFWTWARPAQLWSRECAMRCWVRWNSQHSKKLCLSLSLCRKFKLKEGNKSFVPESRESSVFRVFFRFLCVWTFYEHYERFIHLNILAICYTSTRMVLALNDPQRLICL